MSSASDLTEKRKQRTLYADRTIKQTSFDTTVASRIQLQGPVYEGNFTQTVIGDMQDGMVKTTAAERANIIATSVPTLVPGAPTVARAVRGIASATVSFNSPAYAGKSPITSYTVTSTPGNITATGTSSPITISGLTNGTAYSFRVVAVNSYGNSPASDPSNPVTPVTIPTAPSGVTATYINNVLKIAFTPSANVSGLPIKYYTVYSNPGNFSVSGTVSPIVLTGISQGVVYTFQATATNDIGESSRSASSTPITIGNVPSSPTNVTAVAGNAQATISFTAPTNTGGSVITGYTVTSIPGGITSSGSASPLTVTGLTNGTAYTFTVVAINSFGASVPSNQSITVIPATIPNSPTAVSAVGGPGTATVSFTPPTNNGGAAITEYTVTSSPGGITASGTSAPITITGLATGTAYTFTVVATNRIGSSAASSPSSPVTPSTVPDAPTAVSATAGSASATVVFTPPVNNGGSAITGYTVTSSPGGVTATGASSPINITGLTANIEYTFTVVATNSNGSSVASTASNSVTPTPSAPLSPENIYAAPRDGAAIISFSPSSDGGSVVLDYTVTVSPGGTTVVGSYTPIVFSGLSNGTAYTFTVTARNAIGSSTESLASNSITPTASLTRSIFTSVGTNTWTAPAGITAVEYVIVGGGGGGGNGYDRAGGGGAGAGMLLNGALVVTPGTNYSYTVGVGGIGGADARAENPGTAGSYSLFATVTALGGGAGFGSRTGGLAGAAQVRNISAPEGGAGSGGGNGGKGGGGAGGAGSNNLGASGGAGGIGLANSISGSSVTYSAGGSGGSASGPNKGLDGAVNSGNGGGGGSSPSENSAGGGNGGSGIVILRYVI